MARSFNSLVSDFTTLSYDSSATTIGKMLLNMGIKKTINSQDFNFNKAVKSLSTGTGVQYYESPYNALKIDWVSVNYSNLWYVPTEVKNGKDWRVLNATSVTSSAPSYWFVSNSTKSIGLFPIPIDSKGTINIGFTKRYNDFGAVAEYSTGSINASANGTIFSGVSGASWGSVHIGKYLQVGGTNSPADGFWFEIANVTTSGSIYVKESIPNAISGGTYLISELSPFPDGFEETPLYFALEIYYKIRELPVLSQQYGSLYRENVEVLKMRDSKSTEGLIEKQDKPSQWDVNSNPYSIFIQ